MIKKNDLKSPIQIARMWRRSFVFMLVMCLLILALNLYFAELHPANNWGMGYGIAALVFLFGVVLWAWRRRSLRFVSWVGLGQAKHWLYFHIYGGLIFLLLVLMHTGFQIPVGTLTLWLWVISIWTVFSGLLGLALQRWVPRMLASGLSVEVLYERIPALVNEIRDKSETLVAQCSLPVRNFYRKEVAPAMRAPRRRFIYFLDITGGIQTHLKGFQFVEGFLSDQDKGHLETLAELFKTKLEMDAHYTLQYTLRWWSLAHVPTSLVLLLLVALHLFTVFYY